MAESSGEEWDARGIAKRLIERYGIAAISVARYKALWARSLSDTPTMEAWFWIAGAADEMLRAEPE